MTCETTGEKMAPGELSQLEGKISGLGKVLQDVQTSQRQMCDQLASVNLVARLDDLEKRQDEIVRLLSNLRSELAGISSGMARRDSLMLGSRQRQDSMSVGAPGSRQRHVSLTYGCQGSLAGGTRDALVLENGPRGRRGSLVLENRNRRDSEASSRSRLDSLVLEGGKHGGGRRGSLVLEAAGGGRGGGGRRGSLALEAAAGSRRGSLCPESLLGKGSSIPVLEVDPWEPTQEVQVVIDRLLQRQFLLGPWVKEKRLRNQLRLILKDHLEAGPQRRSTATKIVHDAHQLFPLWRGQIREIMFGQWSTIQNMSHKEAAEIIFQQFKKPRFPDEAESTEMYAEHMIEVGQYLKRKANEKSDNKKTRKYSESNGNGVTNSKFWYEVKKKVYEVKDAEKKKARIDYSMANQYGQSTADDSDDEQVDEDDDVATSPVNNDDQSVQANSNEDSSPTRSVSSVKEEEE